jgi:hypothetical protein
MARQKRSSPILEAARRRLAGLKAIKPKTNYGPGLAEEDFEQDIVGPETLLAKYNQMSSEMDDLLNQIQAGEARANDKSRRILSYTEATYGPDSSEYEMVGGTRTSERKKPGRKKGGGTGTPTSGQ